MDMHKPELECATVVGPARFTIVTSTFPEVLTKRFSLSEGKLKKEGGGVLVAGSAEVREASSLSDFAALLPTLEPDQALIYGVPPVNATAIVTSAVWEAEGRPEGKLPRTNETFAWPTGPAILMIDYDPENGSAALSREALVEAICSAVPALRDVEMLWWPSASSHIHDTSSGEDLTGLRGQRLYIVVMDGRDIPRAGKVIADRLWLAGHGYVKVSASGSLLPRTLVDTSVWQTSRLDFAAGAQCEGPLVQDRGEPTLIASATKLLDTQTALPDLTGEEKEELESLIKHAKSAKSHEAALVRQAWLARRAHDIAGPDATDSEVEQAKRIALRALETGRLASEFVIQVIENGKIVALTVADILGEPARYHRAKTLDPIEPDYDNGRAVGMLFLDGPAKTLHSFARGGTTYSLTRNIAEIFIPSGKLADVVDETLAHMREHPALFDFGDEVVLQDGGRPHVLQEHGLNQLLGSMIQYWRLNKYGNPVNCDPPANLAKRIIALQSRRKLKRLTGVITAPTLRLDGSVLDRPGYDEKTGLFLYRDREAGKIDVPLSPSHHEVKAALDRLWSPFEEFPFVDAVDKGGMLAALITAVLRPVLPTAPAFGFDAPVQGSGKTLLASCVVALAGVERPSVYPHTTEEPEVRKRLLSALLAGTTGLIWDNVLGTFDSPSLAAFLTSSTYSDRILGVSRAATLPNRALLAITGNNLTPAGDMVRRILAVRIDPGTDTPHAREFDLDPLAFVAEHRDDLVLAALTLVRGWLTSGAPPATGRMASFEDWNDLVRNTVAWVARVIAPGAYADPMDAVTRALANDPELEALSELLQALEAKYGHAPFTSADVMKAVMPYKESTSRRHEAEKPEFRLYEALITINPAAVATTASLGRTLGYRKDRIVDGRVLRQTKDPHSKSSQWWVAMVA